MDNNIANLIASMKGLAGSGGVLGQAVKGMVDYLMTMEPGDIVRANPPTAIAAPIASDLWYLWYHANFLAKYYEGVSGFDGRHFDYNPYLVAQLGFLSILPGLKPLKVVCDLKQLTTDISTSVFGKLYHAEYANNGVYWINTMAFELCPVGISEQYPSGKPSGDYVGYVTFPIGQLGAMEVVSLLQETDLSGYAFAAVENLATYHVKIPKNNGTLLNEEKPSLQTEYQIFPDAKNSNGNVLSGQNYCYGRHLIESAYIVPSVPKDSQNKLNSRGTTAYAPIPKLDVELFSKDTGKYPEDVKPKMWMRYWIHRDSTLPVPGEFLGILCRPVATPPHVWWFQESSPFVYAGNWVETENLTSGVVTAVTLETARTDGGIGNQYTVKIQGCEFVIDSSDFMVYSVGDRVAILKLGSTATKATKSFTWLDQTTITEKTEELDYVIIPVTFYIKKT